MLISFIIIINFHWRYSPSKLFGSLSENGRIISAAGVIVFYLIRPFVFWPLSVASVFLGYLYGFPEGVPLVLVGTLLTCSPPYILANQVQEWNGYASRISDTGEILVNTTGELRGMIAARLSPAPADGVSIGAGLAGVSARRFALGTLVGELPWAVFYVVLGQSLQTFSSHMTQNINFEFLLFASLCAVLLVARPLYQLLFKLNN